MVVVLPIIVGLTVTLWTVVVLLSVRGELDAARASLLAARETGDVEAARPDLASAKDGLARSAARLAQPGPALVGRLPVLGRTVSAVRRATDAALQVVISSERVLDTLSLQSLVVEGGRVDLQALDRLATTLDQASVDSEPTLRRLRAQPLGLVPSGIGRPISRATEQLEVATRAFGDTAAGLRALGAVLGSERPRSLLVLLQNNAELRGSGGLVSVFAEAQAQEGHINLGRFRDVDDVASDAQTARRVPSSRQFHDLYGPYRADTTLWKNANMSPDLPTSSEVVAEVAAATLRRRPDVVLWLDVPAIAAVLRATGPATLPDSSVLTADNVIPTLLSKAYSGVEDTAQGQARRRAILRGSADAVLARLLGDSARPSAAALAGELAAAVGGRHVALWSADGREQAQLTRAGLSGAVRSGEGDLVSLAVHNLGDGGTDGNKLDFYARRQDTVQVHLNSRRARVTQQFTLRNTAPAAGLPTYVAGRPNPGTTNNLVAISLPRDATSVTLSRDGRALPVVPLPAVDHRVLMDTAVIAPGASTSWRVSYDLALRDGRYTLALYPQPLAVPAGLSLEIRASEPGMLQPRGTAQLDSDGILRLSGPFDAQRRLTLDVREPGTFARVRSRVHRFLDEPVRLPG